MTAPISGVNMAISAGGAVEDTARQWRLEDRSELRPYAASNTRSALGRKCSIEDWVGVILGYGYQPSIFPGDSFAFIASVDGTNGYAGQAYCEQLEININQEEGGYIEWAAQLSRNGALTPGAAAASDSAVANPPCSEDLTVTLNGSDEGQVRQARLVFSCPGNPYVHSGTSGGRQRTRGLLDATLEYKVYFEDPSTELPSRDTYYQVGVEVKPATTDPAADALTWAIDYMQVANIVPIVSIEGEENVGAIITMEFSENNGTTAGSITAPDGSELFPFS